MTVYLVWYINPEVGDRPGLWGIYTTKEKARAALVSCGFQGWINIEIAD